jgi:hypothetical protein
VGDEEHEIIALIADRFLACCSSEDRSDPRRLRQFDPTPRERGNDGGPESGFRAERLTAAISADPRGASLDIPVRSNSTKEKQNDEDNQDDAHDTDAALTITVAVTPETATEAAKQEDDEDDDEYQSERQELSPVASIV